MGAEAYAGRHVVVTGGTSGIGLAAVTVLAAAGTRLSVLSRDAENLARLRTDPPPGCRDVVWRAADVAERPQVEAAVAASVAELGPVDLLVTSAGISRPGGFLALDAADFEQQMAVNYFGTLYAIRAVAPAMVERGSGQIACISSVAGFLGVFGYAGYSPTKFAVAGLCEVLRMELKPHGVHVACVFPPDVDTPMLAREEAAKPPETTALAGSIRPLTDRRVVDAMLVGLARRRPRIYPDPMTRLTATLAGAAPASLRWHLDRVVAKSRRQSGFTFPR